MAIESIDPVELSDLVCLVTDQVLSQGRRFPVTEKSDGSLVTQADLQIQSSLADQLEKRWPGIELLGEEMSEADQAAVVNGSSERFWCLDPLDGTGNFTNGIPFFAVSLALIEHNEIVLGVVYDPSRNECFSAIDGKGSFCNGKPIAVSSELERLDKCVAVVDFKRLNKDLGCKLVNQPPYRSQRNFGACALEWCWLAMGRIQLYLHGGMRPWDFAAGSFILAQAEGQACNLNGQKVCLTDTQSCSVVAAANPVLFQKWRDWLCVPN